MIPSPHFDGETYDPAQDHDRLTTQLDRVRSLLLAGGFFTLAEIARRLQIPEASASARIRDLRKKKFGGYAVVSRRSRPDRGLWEYAIALEEVQS